MPLVPLILSSILSYEGGSEARDRTSWHMVCATQVIRPRLLKYLAAFCMLDCVCAATLPSAPAPKFEADVPNPSYNTVCSRP